MLHAGLTAVTPPRSLSDIHLKRTAFSSPHAATACMGRVHGSDRAPPHSLGPDRTPSRNYYPVPLQCYMIRDTVHPTQWGHHHSSMARRCTASGDWGGRPPIRGSVPRTQPPSTSTPPSRAPDTQGQRGETGRARASAGYTAGRREAAAQPTQRTSSALLRPIAHPIIAAPYRHARPRRCHHLRG